ncbi:Uncharacterized protein Fot_55643 [Forsythia ovata]|uniref:Uncharacterized protein n=1 Tax=Forsythia ovata TaxID=205694 RepID=A0ABD1P410_9LAMI
MKEKGLKKPATSDAAAREIAEALESLVRDCTDNNAFAFLNGVVQQLESKVDSVKIDTALSFVAEAESTSEVGRLHQRENGREEATIQRTLIINNRTVERDCGSVQHSMRGVPD